MSAPRPFKVYAIRYATVVHRASENFIGGDPHERGMDMDYFVWPRSASKTWVIDTGFNQAAPANANATSCAAPLKD
jgi:hypothetical protein